MVDAAIPGMVVLGAMRKQTEQAIRSKLVSDVPPCLYQFLPTDSCPDFLDDRLQL